MTEDSRLRRSLFVDGDLVIDLTRREVQVNGEPVALTAKQFRILACLVRHLEDVVSHKTLLLEAWGPDCSVSRQALTKYIRYLRQKLEPIPRRPQRIITERGEGYMLRRLTVEG
jgi:two-component system KDP operon response regulator KdpE